MSSWQKYKHIRIAYNIIHIIWLRGHILLFVVVIMACGTSLQLLVLSVLLLLLMVLWLMLSGSIRVFIFLCSRPMPSMPSLPNPVFLNSNKKKNANRVRLSSSCYVIFFYHHRLHSPTLCPNNHTTNHIYYKNLSHVQYS